MKTQSHGRNPFPLDYKDDPDKAAPAIFQAVYRHFASLVFQDEVGTIWLKTMLNNWYFWEIGSRPWFSKAHPPGSTM